jgi:hypothetical protein
MSGSRRSTHDYRAAPEPLICSPETLLNLLLDSAITYLLSECGRMRILIATVVNRLAPSIPIPARLCDQVRFCCYLFAI